MMLKRCWWDLDPVRLTVLAAKSVDYNTAPQLLPWGQLVLNNLFIERQTFSNSSFCMTKSGSQRCERYAWLNLKISAIRWYVRIASSIVSIDFLEKLNSVGNDNVSMYLLTG